MMREVDTQEGLHDPEVRKLAQLLMGARKQHGSVDEFERFVLAVESEPIDKARMIATQLYLVSQEEDDPVASLLYKMVGRVPDNVHAFIGSVLTFVALAAASGVVGNIAYDALKTIVLSYLKPTDQSVFEERLTFEEYETVRKELHAQDAPEGASVAVVEKEIGLKYRLIFERKMKG